MKFLAMFLLVLMLSIHGLANASDACLETAISTRASVTVSDGKAFETETHYAGPDHSAILHRDEGIRVVAVEGPFSWASNGDRSELGTGFHPVFALGHQYHAFLLHFGDIVGNDVTPVRVEFAGQERNAMSAEYPYGGKVYLVEGDVEDEPAGVIFDFPETPPINSVFGDWREVNGTRLPFLVVIDDGDRQFDYHYQMIDIQDRAAGWFYEAVAAPALDVVQIYRMHRRLLAAHCRGDAEGIASLTAPQTILADRGQLVEPSREDTLRQFTEVFGLLDYHHYTDLQPPQVTVSESGDLGWIAVNIRATGEEIESGRPFDTQWAWIMLAKKFDGQWLTVGNAANHLE